LVKKGDRHAREEDRVYWASHQIHSVTGKGLIVIEGEQKLVRWTFELDVWNAFQNAIT